MSLILSLRAIGREKSSLAASGIGVDGSADEPIGDGARIAYMWLSDDIAIEIDEADGSEVIIVVRTPAGSFRLAGAVSLADGVLRIDRAHIEGLAPGDLTRGGLNAVGYKILEVTGAESLDLQGSARTTGRNPGRAPRRIRFPR